MGGLRVCPDRFKDGAAFQDGLYFSRPGIQFLLTSETDPLELGIFVSHERIFDILKIHMEFIPSEELCVKRAPKIALLIETSNAYARGLLRGIVAYIREHQPWSLYLSEHNRGDKVPSWLSSWKGDGIIARIENPSIAAALRNLSAPIVDVSAARLVPSLPWFETDDGAVAHLAAEHLLERGFSNFAFAGDSRFNWSKWRGEHFENCIRAAGHQCSVYNSPRRPPPDDDSLIEDLANWLKELPKPVGVMACYDFRGQQVLDACRRHNIAVPDEVAVIGVDNDELLCELSDPPLSSVIPSTHRTGYEAAALLDQMLKGRRVKGETHLIPPIGVATRQSTDVLAIHDRNIARALHYIRNNACNGINVQDVIKAVPQSRRLLEKRFQKYIGRTPHEEIIRVQLDRVKQLLTQTDLPLEEVAQRSGFAHVEYLSVAFKRETGMPPSKFRLMNRPPTEGANHAAASSSTQTAGFVKHHRMGTSGTDPKSPFGLA
jgi:LacI family transcriptional regulator